MSGYFETQTKSLCCGCKVCAAVCPEDAVTFSSDPEGFLYPVIAAEKYIGCNKCRAVCPISRDSSLPAIEDNHNVYAAFSKNDSVLKSSTSGGIFTHISDCILENNGAVFGHKYDGNMNAVCCRAETKAERDLFRGSKYVQSDMGSVYSDIRDMCASKKNVLVSGTPCQISAVKNFFQQSVPRNLYLMDIICHGVPSPGIFKEYISLCETKAGGKKVSGFIFRGKEHGWNTPVKTICYDDGSRVSGMLNADAFNILFQGTECILRPVCYGCPYAGKQRTGDITVADFWGIENRHPDMFNANKGVSLVIVNTEKGRALFEYAAQYMQTKQVPLADAQERNIPLTRPMTPYYARKQFFADYSKHGLAWCIRKYCSRSFASRIRRKIARTVCLYLEKLK